ncbi:hypothetical protein BS47DRAFT_1486294 [Hydnum rufescens UP504]|uniref:Acetyltransferase component of pyruvate dehydrogenase complex n=1 Tax=Hydnum rufescens UP504 TaxID=1448309 RepID=A0A9P6AUS0_9AGAM|nr:hypothetical protein BS47DRAFT_1486294 [Hydnum rufescens UP504]
MASIARILSRRIHFSARRNALSKFTMPAMSPTMTEGGIASWKKKEGDSFTSGDVILEIETDKATMDVEAQDDGVLAKIIAADGSKNIAVGSTIAILAEEGDDLSAAVDIAESESPLPPKESGTLPSPPPPTPTIELKLDAEPNTTSKPSPPRPEFNSGERIFASPIAKKIALERGIPLGKVKGTGPGGRIVLSDIESYKPLETATAGAKTASPSTISPVDSSTHYTDIPISNMRKTIGARLTQSKQELPHYYVTVEIDMGRTLKLRELSVNDFIVKAAALALRDVPEVNSAWLGDTIRQYHKADISIAVATPTGLITPIVRDVGAKGLSAISTETKALAKKARDGKLAPQEYQGGSFTISNMGMMGVSHFTAIINPPQSAILALGSVIPTLVPADNEKGFDTKQILKATLSADHRVVDGAVNAKFLQALKGYLENPLSFML